MLNWLKSLFKKVYCENCLYVSGVDDYIYCDYSVNTINKNNRCKYYKQK